MSSPPLFRILFVCTGNICRSPMAEALLRARLEELRSNAAIGTASAGLVPGGQAAHPSAVEAVALLGGDLSAHRSGQLTAEALEGADLVIGMTREHVREVVALRPDLWARTFTLREVVRRGRAVGPRPETVHRPGWIASLHAGRKTADLLGRSDDDDIDDPLTGDASVFRETAREIDRLVRELAGLLQPSPSP